MLRKFGIYMLFTETTSRILNRKISQHMDTSFLSLDESTMMTIACSIMQKNKKDEVVVLNHDKKPIGIATNKDVLKKLGEANANPQRTRLDDIMTFPLVGISHESTLYDALKEMRNKNVRRLVVFDNGKVLGIIFQHTITSLIRQTVISSSIANYSLRAILWNLGSVLQFAGVLMLIPAVLATVLNDTLIATGIFLMATVFLICGFFLNSYGERHPLSLRGTALMVFSSFLILVLFGTIPYLYVNPYGSDSFVELFSNSFFTSASSFTTTGISPFQTPENLSDSFTFFGSFSQFVGGLSFIYLIMTAFYPENKILTMRSFISGKIPKLRELFVTIAIVFSLYTVIIALLLYYFGERNIIDDFSIAMSALSTGGFVTSSDFLLNLSLPEHLVLIAGMILGSLPFGFHYSLIRKKFMSVSINKEIGLYFIILAVGILVFIASTDTSILNSVFTVIATSTTGGYQVINLSTLGYIPITLLICLMLIGGCGFSTAGGIKIFRLEQIFQFIKSFKKPVWKKIKTNEKKEMFVALILLILFPTLPIPVAYHLSYQGNDLSASYFESVGAITTAGLGTGIINMDLDSFSKILVSSLMILGRLEIILLAYIFVPKIMP